MSVYICPYLCVGGIYKINFVADRILLSEEGAQLVTEKFHVVRLSHKALSIQEQH